MALEKQSSTRFSERVSIFVKRATLAAAEVIVSLLGYESSEGTQEKGLKTAGLFTRLGVYLIADNWINILHISVGATLKLLGFNLLAMWAIIWVFDFLVAGAFILVYEMTGKDLSLGVDLRRAADTLARKSRLLGALTAFWNAILSIVWFGPERVVTYYRQELGTRARVLIALIVLTAIQAFLWAALYSCAYNVAAKYL